MSEENVEVVRLLYNRWWGRADWRGGRELFDDGCEFVFSTSGFPDPGAYSVGREAMRAWMNFTGEFEEFAMGVDRIVEAGERVVALIWMRGRGRASGADVDGKAAGVFTLRDGKIIRCELTNRQDALEAAGVEE